VVQFQPAVREKPEKKQKTLIRDEQLEKLASQVARAREMIDGAIWEIEHNPEKSGFYVAAIDTWVATLNTPPVTLYYAIPPKYVVHAHDRFRRS